MDNQADDTAPRRRHDARPGAPVVFKVAGRGPAIAVFAGIPLVVVGVLIVAFASPIGGVVLVLLGLAAASTLRQRAVVDDAELVVQGRVTRVRADLASVRAVHLDRVHIPWVACEGQRPFRVTFTQDPAGFVAEVRRRAVVRGAPLDPAAELSAPVPAGTRPLFSM